jgi:hypothetical protein
LTWVIHQSNKLQTTTNSKDGYSVLSQKEKKNDVHRHTATNYII